MAVLALVAAGPAGSVQVGPDVASATAVGRGGIHVTVKDPVGEREVTLGTAEDVVPAIDVVKVVYTRRSGPRDPEGDRDRDEYTGTSAAALAELAGVDPANVSSMELSLPGGEGSPFSSVTLSGDEVQSGFTGDPAGSPRSLFVFNRNPSTGELVIFRPLRDDADSNQVELSAPRGEALEMTVVSRRPIVGVDLDASKPARAKKPVRLIVRPADGADVESVTWRYGDGSVETSSTAEIDHTYAAEGPFSVRAFVTTSDDRTGVGAATVQVGQATTTPDPTQSTPATGANGPGGSPGGGSGTPQAAPTGPNSGSGAAVGGAPGVGTPGAIPGAAGATTTGTPGAATSSAPRRSTPPSARRPERRTSRGSGSGEGADTSSSDSGAARGDDASGAGSPRSVDRRSRRRPTVGADPSGTEISGVLVASRAASVVPISAAGVARAAAARRGAEPKGTSDLAWVLGPLGVIGLLGAGAARELRPGRRTLPTTRMPTT